MKEASPGELLFIPSPVLRLFGEDIEFRVTCQGRDQMGAKCLLASSQSVSSLSADTGPDL